MASETRSGGIGFLGLLTILFIGLKLTGYIEWSWWLVLLPTLIPAGIVVLLLTFAAVIALVAVLKS